MRSPLLDPCPRRQVIWPIVALLFALTAGLFANMLAYQAQSDLRTYRQFDNLYRYNAKLYRAGFELFVANQYLSEILNQHIQAEKDGNTLRLARPKHAF